MELKSQDQKNQELYEEYKKISLVLEMTTLLEQKIQCYKKQQHKSNRCLSARQDSNTKRRYLYATNFALTTRTTR
jgi:hypothetical protein